MNLFFTTKDKSAILRRNLEINYWPDESNMEKHIAQNIQDAFLNTARRDKVSINVKLMNGENLSGRIKSFDKFSVLLDVDGSEVLVFKHTISTITAEKKKSNFG